MAVSVLLRMLRKGVGVTAATLVWTNGMQEWASMREVGPFRSEAALEGLSWHYVDAESGEQKGPVPSRCACAALPACLPACLLVLHGVLHTMLMLLPLVLIAVFYFFLRTYCCLLCMHNRLLFHFMEEGKVDGMTQIFDQRQGAWVQLGQVSELKQVMQQMAAEEDARASVTASASQSDQVYEDAEMHIPAIPEEMYKAAGESAKTTAGAKRSFKSDNGTSFVWDDTENDWVEDENPSGSEGSDYEMDEPEPKRAQPVHSKAGGGKTGAPEGGGDGEGAVDENGEKAGARKRKKKKKKAAAWKENASGLWVYVTGLPHDVSEEELKSHFSKVSIIIYWILYVF
jgi:hypothetical protein